MQLEDGVLHVTNTAQTASSFQQHVGDGSGLHRMWECAGSFWRGGPNQCDWIPFNARRRKEFTNFRRGRLDGCCASTVTDADSNDVAFGLRFPAGAVVEVKNLQLEAQPGRSAYKRTAGVSGRFEETRFDQSSLTFRADGIEDYATTVHLTSRVRLL